MIQLILLLLKCSLYSVTFLFCSNISMYSLLRYSAFGRLLCTSATVRRFGSGLYRRSWTSLPTSFIGAQ
jgi:hypothetical protein